MGRPPQAGLTTLGAFQVVELPPLVPLLVPFLGRQVNHPVIRLGASPPFPAGRDEDAGLTGRAPRRLFKRLGKSAGAPRFSRDSVETKAVVRCPTSEGGIVGGAPRASPGGAPAAACVCCSQGGEKTPSPAARAAASVYHPW